MSWRGYGGQGSWSSGVRPPSQQQGWQQPRPSQGSSQVVQARQPGLVTQAPGKVVPQKGGPETYVVYTRGGDTGEVVVKTLIGTYVEQGSNHGRKVYKQQPEQGEEVIDVFLYFWDDRDGAEHQGWWFGNKLGGTQVWSHNRSTSLTPPLSGWKIPWNGTERNTLVVTPKADQQKSDFEGKFKGAREAVAQAETKAKEVVEQAKKAAGDYDVPEGLQAAEQLLTPQIFAIGEALKKLAEVTKGASGEQLREFTKLGTTLRATQSAVNTELAKVRSSKNKANQSAQRQQKEESDRALYTEVQAEAVSKSNAAEDAVEKAVITSEMISAAGDDMEEVKQAVAATEQAVQEAQKAMGEARIFLNSKQAVCKRFESEKVKNEAIKELSGLQAALQEAQQKLNPLKTVRQDLVQRTAAQKMVTEILAKLSPAEVDVDRAEEATVILSNEKLSKDMMSQAEASVQTAIANVSEVIAFIDQRKRVATGMAKEEVTKLEQRARAAQTRLQELKNTHKEAAERNLCVSLLQEATEKIQSVAESVGKAQEAEGPFLMGVEELPLDESLAAVKACELAATSANTAVSIARMFIATKMVEAKRFAPGPSQEAQGKLKEYQAELETHTKKLAELKKANAERKKASTMREAESEVQKAEELARKVGEVAAVFEDDAKLFELSSKEIRAASDETIKAEQAANAALAEARKFLTGRQIEAKGKEMSTEVSAELIKFQTRLTTAQAEVGRFKKLSSSVEQRLAAKKVLEEGQSKLKAAEDKVAKVAEVVESMGQEETAEDGKDPDEAKKGPKSTSKVTKGEQAAAEAQVAIKTVTRYIEAQMRMQSLAKDELAKLQPQIKEVQERLDATVTSMRERSDKLVVDGIIKESETRVSDAEAAVGKVVELEAEFNKGGEDLPIDKASTTLTELEGAISTAHTAVGGTKTALAMKRLAAKRLTPTLMQTTTEQLTKLQERLDATAKRLTETKKGMAERKLATIKREVTEKVNEVEQKVAAAVEATKALADLSADTRPEEMKGACEKAGSTQTEAHSALTSTRSLLLNRQRDAKLSATDTEMLADITKMMDKLTRIQGDLDKQRSLLRDQEHKFVAQRLLKDATEAIEKLEKKATQTEEIAVPLDKEDFTPTVFLSYALDTLKAHMKEASKTAGDLFSAMVEDGKVTEAKFVSFYQGLAEASEQKDAALSEEQLQKAFGCIAPGAEVNEKVFLAQFLSRYICSTLVSMTDTPEVKGGKVVRKIEPDEILEALSEPEKDTNSGVMRVKCRAEKDDKEGYISVAGNQGTVYLAPYSPYNACVKKIENALQDLADNGREVTKYLDQKVEELKSVRTGPLAETKAELVKMRPRVSKVQYAHSHLKKKLAEQEKKMKQCLENERRKRQEALDKKAADAMTNEVEQLVNNCTAEAEKAVASAEALAASKATEQDNPLQAIDDAIKVLDVNVESLDKATAKIKEHMDSLKNATKGPFSEARSVLVKQKVKAGALDSKCKKQLVALRSARKRAGSDAHEAIVAALRAHFLSAGLDAATLFKELSAGQAQVSLEALRGHIEKIPDTKLKASHLDLGLERYTGGVAQLVFSQLVQEFQRCVREIAMTTDFKVKDSKTVRKLVVGEVVQVVEASKLDETTGLHRVKCRSLCDGKEGWATLRGNQGTDFLEKTGKPYFCCSEEVPMQADFGSASEELRKVQPGAVLEVLEGPRQEPELEVERVRGKTAKDSKSGWVTLKDSAGTANFEEVKLLTCRHSIAITSTFDISEGKALRKLEVGELLEIVEGPQEDEKRILTRIKARSKTDDKEGWVTMKGNQGTSYVEETTKFWLCKRKTSLDSRFSTDSSQLRELDVDELLEVLEGPKTETKEGPNRVKCRNLADGSEGWFTLSSRSMSPWSPLYKCAQSTTMTETLAIKEAKTVRKVEEREILEVLEIPTSDPVAGVIRVRVRAEKDGAIGFVTVQGNQGTVLLKPFLDGL